MAVRTVPPNAIRDKTGKKAVRPESLYQFERFVAPLVCPFGYCPSDSPRLTRNKAKALR